MLLAWILRLADRRHPLLLSAAIVVVGSLFDAAVLRTRRSAPLRCVGAG